MAERFYPRLSTIAKIEDLPEQLSFLNAGISAVFDNLFFKDLQFTKSEAGDAAFYSLKIIAKNPFEFTIPGIGVTLSLNHSVGALGFMEIPITLSYEWKILKFIRGFKLDNFSFESGPFFDTLAKALLGMSGSDLLKQLFGAFFSEDPPATALSLFVSSVNAHYGVSAVASSNPNFEMALLETISSVVIATGKDPFTIVYEVFLKDPGGIEEITLENVNKLFEAIFGMPPVDYVKDLLIPKISASLRLQASILFARNILTPLDTNGDPIMPETILSSIDFAEGDFFFSTETGIGYKIDLAASMNYVSMIGKTGLTIHFSQAKLDISRTSNIPEATLDGRPEDFVGVYIGSCEIGLPPFVKDDTMNPNPPGIKIVGKSLLIGTGGLSGTIGLETTGPGLYKKFGDRLQVGFTAFDIRFHQNSIIESNVLGYLIIPGFKDSMGNDAKIDIRVHFGTDGDFSVTASEDQGITLIKVPDVFSVDLKSVTVGRKDQRFFIAVSGSISFEDMGPPIGQFLPDKFEVTKLLIWDDGKIEFEGGKITLPKAISLKIGPVELSVTAIGLGSHEQMLGGVMRQYKYFTFDGGIDTGPGGVDVSGKGIAFYYTVDGLSPFDFFVRIQSIAIDIIIPGSAKPADAALLLKGYLAMKDPENGGDGTEYIGGIEFTLPKLKMGGSASMRLNPKVPAWIVDVGLELSTPIVLGSTGLGIYGFRGLVGQRYVATKNAVQLADDAPWWQYYKAKVDPKYQEGVDIGKFEQTDGFSLGAGVSLATVPDAGKTFSSKIFFLLSLPEVFLLQGQGQILKERIGLDTTTDPPFFALLAISSTSIEAAFGVNYKVPDDGTNPGSIATVNALIEMGFFWGNSAAWYINLGKDQPEDRRIQVRLLTLFDAYFYMMLSSSGIRAGAGVSYELKKKFGPLRAELYAYMDVAGKISFKPKQIGGSIEIGGGVGLYIFGFGFSLSVHAGLAAEAPKPFIVSGTLKACIRVLRKERCAKFNFTWTFEPNLHLDPIKLLTENTADAAKAINMQTKEVYSLYGGSSVPSLAQLADHYVPCDAFIDLEFVRGVLPGGPVLTNFGGNTMGSNYISYVAPQRGKSDRVRHEFLLEDVIIKYHNGTTWAVYDIYDAATPLALAPFVTTNLSTLPDGYWQYQTANQHNKLRILGQSPIEYVSQGSGDLILEDSNITAESIFCGPEPIEKQCITFATLNPQLGTQGGEPLLPENALFFHMLGLFHLEGGDGVVTAKPYMGMTHAIWFRNGTQLVVDLIGPMVCVDVTVFASDTTCLVTFYERVQVGLDTSNMPVYSYVGVSNSYVGVNQGLVVAYNDLARPVERIVLESGMCGDQGYYYYYGGGGSGGGGALPKSGAVPLVDGEEKMVFRSVNAKPESVGGPVNISVANSGNANSGDGCDMSPEALQLVQFLNTVIARKEHTSALFHIWPQDLGAYNGVFYNTVLYGTPQTGISILGRNTFTANSWNLHLQAGEQYGCDITVTAPDGVTLGEEDWLNLVRLGNPRCDPGNNTLGQTNSFLVDAYFRLPNGGFTILTLTVTSCYMACHCKDVCGVYVYEICMLPYEDAAYNNTLPSLPDVQDEIQTMINGFEGSIRPIWRPDTAYCIEVHARDALYRESGSSSLGGPPQVYYFGFRTAGPPGHFHQYLNPAGVTVTRPDYSDLVLKDRQDEFKLSRLLYYIDMGKSYPNADGQLINAKPLFYKVPRISLFYNQPYVYEFYHDWDDYGGTLEALQSSMEVLVKDPAPDPTMAALSPVAASWVINSLPVVSQDVQILNNMILNGGNPCAPSATIHPMAVNTTFALPELEPLKMYTAVFNSKFKRNSMTDPIVREVHRYGFQTSRYATFRAQIQSYLLKESPAPGAPSLESLFVVERAWDHTTQVLVAKDILDITDPMPKQHALRQEFGHAFNRLIEGALKLESIHPPVSTEVNVLKNSLSGHIIGLLVKNPEPFNDPKIPLGTIGGSVRMSVNGGPTVDYTALFAKDYAQVFLTKADLSMQVPAGATVVLEFDYLEYNGATYYVSASESLTVQLPL